MSIFWLNLKFYQNIKNHHSGKLNKIYSVNICFAWPPRTVFLNLRFYFCLNAYKLDGSLIFIQKKVLWHIFLFLCHILSFGSALNCKFIRREYGFSLNSKVSLMRSGQFWFKKTELYVNSTANVFQRKYENFG